MFVRLLYESFRRQKRRKLLAGAAIMLGVGVATAMIAVATDIGDKISRELRSYGANLVVTPQEDTLDVKIGGVNLKPASDGGYLNEADIPRIKGMFWRNNIIGVSPMLPVRVPVAGTKTTLLGTYFSKRLTYGKDNFTAGVLGTHPWWKVQGAWPQDDSGDLLVGQTFAAQFGYKLGDTIELAGAQHRVSGIVSTGGDEDHEIVAPISLAQQLAGRPGVVRQIYVSALTKPEDELARRDPKTLSPDMYDRWYCSPYRSRLPINYRKRFPIPTPR